MIDVSALNNILRVRSIYIENFRTCLLFYLNEQYFANRQIPCKLNLKVLNKWMSLWLANILFKLIQLWIIFKFKRIINVYPAYFAFCRQKVHMLCTKKISYSWRTTVRKYCQEINLIEVEWLLPIRIWNISQRSYFIWVGIRLTVDFRIMKF